jgi:hypothetical protein
MWQAAVALASEHGVGKISRELRLDYYALQRRVKAGVRQSAPIEFVEVSVPGRSTEARCAIAASDPSGCTVRMEIVGLSALELAVLVRAVSGMGL